MNPERWARMKSLFNSAAELPEAEREAFLEREAGDDVELLAQLRALLDAHETEGGFLEAVSPELRVAALDANDAVASPELGERIGAYRLVEMIGSGGMGDVYKAVRDDDEYRAEVAIKLMRADVRNPLSEQRFKSERQILAALDHRNIARLLDGGTTPRGLPYVVMELVEGKSIDQYCESHSLSTRERVQLFLQVCAAVSFAHQHLVVHRDLKPNNILVTADGSVKLLDFGIAKLLEPDPATGLSTDDTRTQLRAMTLEYASPEQVSGSTVTTVSDVYSLGVVLYRLLTGQSPYKARGDAARAAEILSDTSPTRPSAVVTQNRQTIDADLDYILLMALRKEPAKRYGSVEQLGADLRNYLSGRPVAARRGTLGYRAAKFIRRNKMPFAAAAVVVLSLVVALAVSIRETRIANAERATAQRHFSTMRQMANAMVNTVFEEIDAMPGGMKARVALAKTAHEFLEVMSREAAGNHELQLDVANAWRKLGDTQGGQNAPSGGDSAAALASYDRAIALWEQVVREDPSNQRAQKGLVIGLMSRARVVLVTEGPKAAMAQAERALQVAQAIQTFASDYDRMQILNGAHYLLADVYMPLGRASDALVHYDKMVAINEEYSEKNPDDLNGLRLLRNAYHNSGIAIDPRQTPQQSFERTVALLRQSVAVTDKLLVKEPDSVEHKTRLAEQLFAVGTTYTGVDRHQEGLEYFLRASPILVAAAKEKTDARAVLVYAMNEAELAAALAKTGDVAGASRPFADAEQALLEVLKKDPQNLYAEHSLAQLHIYRGEMFVGLAERSQNSATRQDYLRKARADLTRGLARERGVDARYPLAGYERKALDVGTVLLSRLEGSTAAAR